MYSKSALPDYQALIAELNSRAPQTSMGRRIKLAILADFTTHQLVQVLKALGLRVGINFEIYEANYDTIEANILDPASELYEFKPDCLIIFSATAKLVGRYYAHGDKSEFTQMVVAHFAGLWEAFQARCPVTVVQATFPLPAERAFGNYEQLVPHALGAVVSNVNRRLAEEARARRGVLLCDIDYLAGEVGRANWRDERMWALAKLPCRLDCLPLLGKLLLDVVRAATGFFVKCVVLDLDNTLWGGVIGDDGLSGIDLGGFDEGEAFVNFQHFLRSLKERGIILAVVSKNDEDNARQPFREHPDMVLREQDIAVFIANWDNKADNIRRVQETLNISFDSMIFLDDSPFERGLVRKHLPDVIVPELPEDPVNFLPALAQLNLFETATFSEADRRRADQYREEAARALAREVFTNLDGYLQSLNMVAKLERFNPVNLRRIAQLIQRSNQFNLMTRRYSEAACANFIAEPDHYVPITVSLADRFGDYGLISVIVLSMKASAVEIDEYLMSCRVLKRGVEQFVMNRIFAFAALKSAKQVIGRYHPTGKNRMVENFYSDFGFTLIADEAAVTTWSRDVNDWVPQPVSITASICEI